MRLLIVTNINKPRVGSAMHELVPWISSQAEVIGVDTNSDIDLSKLKADAIVVFGGDGTLLHTARRLRGNRVPMMGVNFGRLGFLASFTPEQFRDQLHLLLDGKLPISARVMMEASVVDAGVECKLTDDAEVNSKRRWSSTALNDAVITAGAPFRMIELTVGTDLDQGVRFVGDGMIIATASGSTAYNLAAGGPILSPSLDGLCITPLAPQSLSFRPVVMPASTKVMLVAKRINRGTTLFCDGQESIGIKTGDRVVIRKSPHEVLVIENPTAREWSTLAEKLNWAASPRYNITPR